MDKPERTLRSKRWIALVFLLALLLAGAVYLFYPRRLCTVADWPRSVFAGQAGIRAAQVVGDDLMCLVPGDKQPGNARLDRFSLDSLRVTRSTRLAIAREANLDYSYTSPDNLYTFYPVIGGFLLSTRRTLHFLPYDGSAPRLLAKWPPDSRYPGGYGYVATDGRTAAWLVPVSPARPSTSPSFNPTRPPLYRVCLASAIGSRPVVMSDPRPDPTELTIEDGQVYWKESEKDPADRGRLVRTNILDPETGVLWRGSVRQYRFLHYAMTMNPATGQARRVRQLQAQRGLQIPVIENLLPSPDWQRAGDEVRLVSRCTGRILCRWPLAVCGPDNEIRAHEGRYYFGGWFGRDGKQRAFFTCRPGDSVPHLIARVSPTAHLQYIGDRYLLWTDQEAQENWFDWSETGLRVKYRTRLYIYRLPDEIR